MKTLKVFKSGNSLAIRIPKDWKLEEGEVYAIRQDNGILIIPNKLKWERLYDELEKVKETSDFLLERHQPQPQERDVL